MEIKDRIKQIIEELGVKTASFEKTIGVANSYLRNVKNVSAETCKSIVEVYPQISLEWLITGNGEMFSDKINAEKVKIELTAKSGNGGASSIIGNPSVGGNASEHDELIRLREENKYLKSILADKDKEITENRRLINHFIGQA